MTSIPVGNVGNGVQTIPGAKSTLDFTNAQKAGSFQDAMDLFGKSDAQTAEKQPKVQPEQTAAEQKQPIRPGKDVVDSGAGKERISNLKPDDAQPQTELSEEELEKVQETAADIMRAIAEELDVSPEEVEQAMQLLGISFADLGNSNQMAALMTELMDLTDSIQIVTDATLFESCTSLAQNADELLAGLSEEIDVPVENFAQLLPRPLPENDFAVETLPMEEEMASDAEIVQEFVKELAAPEIASSDERVPDYVPVQAFTETKAPVSHKEPEREEAAPRTEAQDTVVKVQTEPKEQAVTPERNPESRMQDKGSEPKEHSVMYKNVTAFAANFEQAAATQEVSQPMTQTATVDDIMRQIGDYVRLNATPDVKEMEIQLTPANLGQVHINIASRNGVVTAQITTENEIVKQAMEKQVVQLRERLESQGVRIEAVEVTVASHEFERNLDENGENRDTGGEGKKPSAKRWNLSEMGDDMIEGEALTDAEQVELDMMKLRGGNLNYMV